MFLWDWFISMFKSDGTLTLDAQDITIEVETLYKTLAVESAANLIANTIARSEFMTFEKGEEVRKNNYYIFNVEPNQNQCANKFWRKVIYKLIYDNEVLVVQVNGRLYVADDYEKHDSALKGNVYSKVIVGDYPLNDSFDEGGVLHLELNNNNIRQIIDVLFKDYGKLIASSSKFFKTANSPRGILDIPTKMNQNDDAKKNLEKLLNEQVKRFFNAEGGAVLPLTNEIKYTELESNIGDKGASDTRGTRKLIDDVFDFVAMGFNIPPSLLKNETANLEDAVDRFLTFCINPIAETIEDEINRKMYGKKDFLSNTFMKLDTSRIKAVNITDIAGSLEILTRIGAHTVNDNRRYLGKEEIHEEWADKHYITKNYEEIDGNMRGGGENE